ncbi:hypothetical protein [Algicella marina]|uniref:Uncharacterized protein n=1 Tax=Algicella marina TaxID=2683284 RepID=A0A6P1T404_9RHOB|nr:hypothetical protein [Algicella marina]QHQ36226.1 hypothetical protein GO499_14130 [Algicella marina]
MRFPARIIRISTLCIALGMSTALVAVFAMPEAAIAKGNDGGNGNGNGGNKGGNGKGKDKSASARGNGNAKGKSGTINWPFGGNRSATRSNNGNSGGKTKTVIRGQGNGPSRLAVATSDRPVTRPRPSRTVDPVVDDSVLDDPIFDPELVAAHPSELGALNAAHASPNGLANAAPNSRVGRIAAYRDAALEGIEINDDLAAAREILDGMDIPDRTADDIGEDLATARAERRTLRENLDQLREDLEAAGGSDPDIEVEITSTAESLRDANGEIRDLRDELDTASTYEGLVDEVDELEDIAGDQRELERSLLEAASNKPVTDSVEVAVRELLGLD